VNCSPNSLSKGAMKFEGRTVFGGCTFLCLHHRPDKA
jgi:hypothetical protein